MDRHRLQPEDAANATQPLANPPFAAIAHYPDLDYFHDIEHAVRDLDRELLGKSTEVVAIQCASKWTDYRQATLDHLQLDHVLETSPVPAFQMFSISRFLRQSRSQAYPDDYQKLRISSAALRHLIQKHEIPASLIAALSRPYQTTGTGMRSRDNSCAYWCLLPVRVPVPCPDGRQDHTQSTAGSNQMDPFHYIHLSDAQVDIRGSQIAIFFSYDKTTASTVVAVFNLLDSRWKKIAEEPLLRMKEVISSRRDALVANEPSFVPLVYLSSIVRWWNNVLSFFNHQLIAHERGLQNDMEGTVSASPQLNTVINKALHIMAAHLHRYSSELERLAHVVQDLIDNHSHFCPSASELEPSNVVARKAQAAMQNKLAFEEIQSRLRAVRAFSKELERKIDNILALLFHQIQVTNDKTMQAILQAAQNEAAESHKLAVSMKEDSIAMKTIAILTMAFLPGTSYAALLSMPFFNDDKYLNSANRMWIWVLLTVPSTGIAFLFYWWLTKRRGRRIEKEIDAGEASAKLLDPISTMPEVPQTSPASNAASQISSVPNGIPLRPLSVSGVEI